MRRSEASDRSGRSGGGIQEKVSPAPLIGLVINSEDKRTRLESELRTLGYEVPWSLNSLDELTSSHPAVDLIITDDQVNQEGEAALLFLGKAGQKEIPNLYLIPDNRDAPSVTRAGHGLRFPCTPRELLIAIELVLGHLNPASAGEQSSESEINYRTLWAQDVAANAITSRDGHFIDCNDTFLQMLGYQSVEELRSIAVDQLYLDPSDRFVMLEAIHDTGKLEFYELTLKRKDGGVVHCIANLFGTFDEQGDLIQIHSHLIDNTRQKRMEEQLRNAHKMEAIGRLTGGIAHDFNNLLTAILGYSELLLRQLKDDRLRGDVEQISNAAYRASTLTRQLLAYSRRQVLQPRSLDLNQVVRDMEEMITRVISSDIQLKFSLESELGSIHADPGQIQQIILNMIVNGRDAMPRGGKFLVETKNLFLTGDFDHEGTPIPDAAYVMLAVQDTGTGIERSVVERMFDPYFTTKELGRASGLGLATVYGIVKQSNGYIRIETLPGHGTRFEVLFPTTTAGDEERGHLLGRKVLFILSEDQKKARLVYSLLTEEGFTVLEPARSSELPARLSSLDQPVDLWVFDSSIARQRIPEVEELIRKERPGARILSLREVFRDRGQELYADEESDEFDLVHRVRKALNRSNL